MVPAPRDLPRATARGRDRKRRQAEPHRRTLRKGQALRGDETLRLGGDSDTDGTSSGGELPVPPAAEAVLTQRTDRRDHSSPVS